MRLTSQRGVSLMLLIVMITVFVAVAMGIVTLLRTRHETYPYQVQSYQALALADAGIQFATRYALDNEVGFGADLATYIVDSIAYDDKKPYHLGNGKFYLRYEPATTCTPGQMGTLYCKGVVGRATREVKITDFGGMIGKISGNHLLASPDVSPYQGVADTWDSMPPGEPFTGWRVVQKLCGTAEYGQNNIWINVDTVKVAVSYPPGDLCRINPPQGGNPCANPLYLGRLVVSAYDNAGNTRFAWDEVCDRTGPLWSPRYITMPHWDGVTVPPPAGQYIQPTWNVIRPDQYPSGDRTPTGLYCDGQNPGKQTAVEGQLWDTHEDPIALDFTSQPPPGTKYYIEFVTTYDHSTQGWLSATNRYVFYVR